MSRARPYARTIPRGSLSFALPLSVLLSQPGFLYLFPLLLPPISVSFFGNCSSTSYSLLLSARRSRFSSSFSLFLSRLLVVLVPLAFQRWSVPLSTTAYSFPRSIPCSDCLTPTLHVRTTERPPPVLFAGSAHDQPLLSFSLVPLSEKPRATEGAPFAKDFPGLSQLPPPRSYPILRPRPDQPSLSEIFRRSRACTSLHLTPWSSPRPWKCAGQSRAHVRHFHSCHSSRIRPGGETGETGNLFIILASKRALLEEKGVTPFFPL